MPPSAIGRSRYLQRQPLLICSCKCRTIARHRNFPKGGWGIVAANATAAVLACGLLAACRGRRVKVWNAGAFHSIKMGALPPDPRRGHPGPRASLKEGGRILGPLGKSVRGVARLSRVRPGGKPPLTAAPRLSGTLHSLICQNLNVMEYAFKNPHFPLYINNVNGWKKR